MKKKERISLPPGTNLPNHIAMILDGNRRWARARGLQPWEGHKAGYQAIKRLGYAVRELGIHTFTIWAFSTENWERPQAEVDEIVHILRLALKDIEKDLHQEKMRLVHLGRKDRFPADVVSEIRRLESESAHYTNYLLNIALDYGGKDEIVRATNKILESKLANADTTPINEKVFESYLDTADQPYPYVDLFIRTSGEQRTSGLLPLQMAYAEFYWEQDHLPDFTPEKLVEAVVDYSRRRRRFGGNDAVEHMRFNPEVVADLEIKWQRALAIGDAGSLKDEAINYLKEQYGLSKDLAKEAGIHLVSALAHRKADEWEGAKKALVGLYELIKRNVGLAFEPEIVANFEINLWQHQSEEGQKQLIAEKFRFSEFQATKSAHLAYMANMEMKENNWTKAKVYLEKFYSALKERVA